MTVNGLGERCGNAPLSSVQVILKDHFNARTNIRENKLNDISRLVESYSGIAVAPNQPIIGDNVCMQANSIVVVGVKIGNHVLIAPGAFVNFDVPDNCIVIGNPGKIIQRNTSPTDKYNVYRV